MDHTQIMEIVSTMLRLSVRQANNTIILMSIVQDLVLPKSLAIIALSSFTSISKADALEILVK